MRNRLLFCAFALLGTLGCAQGQAGDDDGVDPPDASGPDPDGGGGCGELCDQDDDGVIDSVDECPDTPPGEDVNDVGCSDSQVDPTLEPDFPPFGLTWTPTGDLGRPGGLTWSYTGIDRTDVFHIYWIVCDDPATTCGVSLDGGIDVPAEYWAFSAPDSDLPNGRLVYLNTTRILLADGSTPGLTGRLTVTIAAIPFADVGSLGVTARSGTHGAEIPGAGFQITALAEVQDASLAWTPYLDYYDAAPTPEGGGSTSVSFGGSFYGE